MKGISLNKSLILELKPQEAGWAIKAPRPGSAGVLIKPPKNKEKTDCGQQMVTAFAMKHAYKRREGIGERNKRLDMVIVNSKRAASITEARYIMRRRLGVDVNGVKATSGLVVPAFAVIKDKAPLRARPVAHAIKNIIPNYPHLIRVDNSTTLYLREREGVYKPKKISTARINRLVASRRVSKT